MKKYKYTQLLEISLGLALEKIERLENSKPPLIPDKDPKPVGTVNWGPSEKAEHTLTDLETTPNSVKATWIKQPKSWPYTEPHVSYHKAGDSYSLNVPEVRIRKAMFYDADGNLVKVEGTLPCSGPNTTNYKKSDFPEGLNLTPKDFTAGPLEMVISSINHSDYPDIEAIRNMESQVPKGELVSSLLDYEPKTTFPVKRPHQPETVEWCRRILEDFPKPGAMITLLKDKLGVTRDQLAKLLNVGKGTITDWSKNPEQYYNPYKLENLTKLYDEHFPKEQPEDSGPMTPERLAAFRALKPQDNIFEETLVPFVKGEDDIILQKPLKENPVVYPASAKRPPRLLNHNDQVTRLQLSQRTLNALERAHIITVGDLVGYTESALKKLKGLGNKSFKEVVNATLKAGFRFTRLH